MTGHRWATLVLLLGGCSGSDDDATSLPPADLETSAGYSLVTHIDVSAAALLPETAASYLEFLRLLHDDPGEAFFVALDEAGVPLVDELRAALPDVVEDKVAGWISDAIPGAFQARLGVLLALADESLVGFDLLSRLDLPVHDGSGRAAATHTATALRFGTVAVAVPQVATVTSVGVAATLSAARKPGAAAHLALGPHVFGLAYGERIFDLLEAQAGEGGLRGVLGELVDCPSVAATVAARCVLSVCVGHATELTALCERGLDEAIDALHDKLASLRFDALRLDAGAADMVDAGSDGDIDTLSGTWQAQANLGMGLRSVAATFTGLRP